MIKLGKNETVVFIGDSITDGNRGRSMDLNHIMGHGFQSIICSRIGADNYENMPKFVNKGISGQSSLEIYARWGRDVIVHKPKLINLLCGVNDVGHGAPGLPPEMVVKKFKVAIEGILEDTFQLLPDVKFVLCEPFYADVLNQDNPYENIPNAVSETDFVFGNKNRNTCEKENETILTRQYTVGLMQKELPEIAKKYGVIYVPFQDVFDNAAKTTPMSYFIWDNIHPTFVGHQLMADRWFEVVEKELNK